LQGHVDLHSEAFADFTDYGCTGCGQMAQLARVPAQLGHAVKVDRVPVVPQCDGAGYVIPVITTSVICNTNMFQADHHSPFAQEHKGNLPK
jgi:hypothetical protein